MSDTVLCENRNCKKPINQNDKSFTIPLDKNWNWQDGTFCSINCALFVNKNEFSMVRQTDNYKEREQWLLEKEKVVGKFDKIKF